MHSFCTSYAFIGRDLFKDEALARVMENGDPLLVQLKPFYPKLVHVPKKVFSLLITLLLKNHD